MDHLDQPAEAEYDGSLVFLNHLRSIIQWTVERPVVIP